MKDVTLKERHLLPRGNNKHDDRGGDLAEIRVYEVGYTGSAFGLPLGPDDYLVEIGAQRADAEGEDGAEPRGTEATRFAPHYGASPCEWKQLEEGDDLEHALLFDWKCAMDLYEGRAEFDRHNRAAD